MSPNIKSIASKVKAIGKRNPVYAEIAQWVGDLLSETVQASGKFRLPDLNQERSLELWFQGRSLLDPGELFLDWKQAEVLYKRLVELVKKRKEGYRQAEGLLRAVDETQDGVPG